MTAMKEVLAHFHEALRRIDRERRSPNRAEDQCFTRALGLLDRCDSGGALRALASLEDEDLKRALFRHDQRAAVGRSTEDWRQELNKRAG